MTTALIRKSWCRGFCLLWKKAGVGPTRSARSWPWPPARPRSAQEDCPGTGGRAAKGNLRLICPRILSYTRCRSAAARLGLDVGKSCSQSTIKHRKAEKSLHPHRVSLLNSGPPLRLSTPPQSEMEGTKTTLVPLQARSQSPKPSQGPAPVLPETRHELGTVPESPRGRSPLGGRSGLPPCAEALPAATAVARAGLSLPRHPNSYVLT